MALNSSGPISLGGATAGQSINLELGQAATALSSINATNARALAGVPSGQISISNFYGKSSESYFFAYTNGLRYASIGRSSSGSIIMTAFEWQTSKPTFTVIASTGAQTISVKGANSGGNSAAGFSPVLNASTGQINAVANTNKVTWTTAAAWVSNYEQTGGISTTGSPAYSNGYAYNTFLTSDSSGNVYVAGKITYVPTCCVIFNFYYTGKYNSSMSSNTWGSFTSATYAYQSEARGAVLNAAQTELITGGLYSTNTSNPGSTGRGMVVFSTATSSGAKNWAYMWRTDPSNSSGTYDTSGHDVAVDSSDNIYSCGYRTGGDNSGIIIKTNSSGTLQWARNLITGQQVELYGIAVDSSANVYVVGIVGATTQYLIIAKYNTSGTIQWIRQLTGPYFRNTGGGSGGRSALMSLGNAFVFGAQASSNQNTSFVGKVPPDGSGTGTYATVGVTYAVNTTLTDAAITLYRFDAYWPQNNGNTYGSNTSRSNTVTNMGSDITWLYQVI